MKSHLQSLVKSAAAAVIAELSAAVELPENFQIDAAKDLRHGDFATNAALLLAKPLGKPPRAVAELLIRHLPASARVTKVEIAGPGFINFFLAADAFQSVITEVLKAGADYGRLDDAPNEVAIIEFVSANPTGPLHVGHGRGAAIGDCIARLLAATGCKVWSEFYYNDAGNQIANLANSVQARARGISPNDAGWPADGYRGDYIADVARAYLAGELANAGDRATTAKADPDDLDAIREFAVSYLRSEQDSDLHAFGVHFDHYYLESSLYSDGKVDQTVQSLIASGYSYEQDDALWLRTTDFGDDKDRVMRKREGGYTYFVPDLAYHVQKWRRFGGRAINEQGADHHGTIARVRAGLQALNLGIPKGWPEYVLHQMVTVMRGGEEVKLSKRAGSYVTLRDLIEWSGGVTPELQGAALESALRRGRDATRYLLVSRKSDSHLVFDIDLALKQSDENPVYYVQYAHARICSVFRQLAERGQTFDAANAALHRLVEPQEKHLLTQLQRYPEMLQAAAEQLAPHSVAFYLRDLADALHSYYNAHKFLVEDVELQNARLALISATRQLLQNGLALLGVSAPEQM